MRRRYNGHLGFYLLLKWDGKLQLLTAFEETNWEHLSSLYALLLRRTQVCAIAKKYIFKYILRKSQNNM